MKKERKTLELPEGVFSADVDIFDVKDRKTLEDVYTSWRTLSDKLSSIQSRTVNIPDGLSEIAVCYFLHLWRTNHPIKGAAHSSFDAYNPQNNERIQIKASGIKHDLTSFGPKSVWDKLLFIDFYREGNWDYIFDIYLIPDEFVYNMMVNKKETFKQQQEAGKRPRFSIYKKIILPKNLKPQYTCNIKTGTTTTEE